jgi:reactive intermediate/imine deaminase
MSAPLLPKGLPFQAYTRHQGLLFLSGMIGHLPGEMTLAGDISAQTHQALDHIEHLLAQEGASLSHLLRATVFLTDLSDWEQVNVIWRQRFQPPYPARTAVEVRALKLGACIEIEAIAAIP